MTKCTFGQALSGEFAGEQSAFVEIEGSRAELGRYLGGLSGLPHFRFVKELKVKAVDPRDARSNVRRDAHGQACFRSEGARAATGSSVPSEIQLHPGQDGLEARIGRQRGGEDPGIDVDEGHQRIALFIAPVQ